ncbi:MAG TPA: MBL fold metallo-hydrolase, partial [Desulfomicrobiaceae bacterium]|nr:MBL fold metallo-hydrolase [Desulfomicrobiaceae bacterium]
SFSFESVSEGELSLLGEVCQVLETPGHSPGCVAYYFPAIKAVFSGDLLFYRSVGRTDFSGGSEELLKRSVVAKIFSLHDQTRIYPGHGPETMVGDEKINNPFFSEFGRL